MAVDAPDRAPTRRFTAAEVERMVEVGILGEDERVELIDGELQVVSPQDWEHQRVILNLARLLGTAYGAAFGIRIQMTISGLTDSLPEPDVAVALDEGPWDAERRRPRIDELLLIVEVAVTSHRLDRNKAGLYATADAPVYWLVDVPGRTITVHEAPNRDGTWQRIREVTDTGLLALPTLDAPIRVADVLPPAPPTDAR
jgi:Uma2 family endonuclease